jgi:hypothetical protein
VVVEEEPEPAFSIDWDQIHPQVIKFYAKCGEWPSEGIEKRLTEVTLEELEQDNSFLVTLLILPSIVRRCSRIPLFPNTRGDDPWNPWKNGHGPNYSPHTWG